MRISASLFGSLCIIGYAPAFADEPPATPAPTTAVTTQVAAPSAAAPSTAETKVASVTSAAAPAAAPVKAGDTEAQIKKYRGMGYKPVTQHGTTVYCRDQTALGSRFPNRVCKTSDDLERQTKDAVDQTRTMQQLGNLPGSKN